MKLAFLLRNAENYQSKLFVEFLLSFLTIWMCSTLFSHVDFTGLPAPTVDEVCMLAGGIEDVLTLVSVACLKIRRGGS